MLAFHTERLVVIVDGLRRPRWVHFALSGVQAADDALEICELLHHVGGEVALGEQCGALGVRGAAEFFCQVDGAKRFFVKRTQLGLEGDVLQVVEPGLEFLLLILFEEEAGVVEAGAQDALVAVADQAVGVGVGVHDGDEVGREVSARIFNRKILLVVPHHGGQDFAREFQILRDRSRRGWRWGTR